MEEKSSPILEPGKEYVVLVDEEDREIGIMEKIEAHKNGGRLHRAFSIFVFNSKGELMLQKRARGKYHSGGAWTNTCCGHPRPGETVEEAALRRLKEEMGFSCKLTKVFKIIYKAYVGNGLTEWELDHVFIGYFDGTPDPNPAEAEDWKWMDMDAIEEDMEKNPGKYTPWFKIIFKKLRHTMSSRGPGALETSSSP